MLTSYVTAPVTYSYLLWICPSLYQCWSITQTYFEPAALSAIFGVLSPTSSLPKYSADLVAFSTLLARHLILLGWKSLSPLTHLLLSHLKKNPEN